MRTAHAVGLRTTSTIMFGHIEAPDQPGPPHPRDPRPAARDRRLHRVRAAAVRARGGADRAQGPGPARPDVPRGRRAARGRAPACSTRYVHEHPGLLGEARARRRARAARRRRERPRRHAHERVDQPRRGRQPRAGMPARAHGGSHPRRRPRARASARRCTATRPAERVAASFAAAPLAPADPPPYDDGGLQRPAHLIRPGLLQGAHADVNLPRSVRIPRRPPYGGLLGSARSRACGNWTSDTRRRRCT